MTRREATGTGEDPESGFNLLGCSLTYIAWHSSGIGVLSLLDRAQSGGPGRHPSPLPLQSLPSSRPDCIQTLAAQSFNGLLPGHTPITASLALSPANHPA